ncbi:MAG: hypothetical protein LBO79_01615 [Zoogloeaceae bacterium]|jgi:hypothetical protein|nr:hypothetical protein [Zoogloeaceae bacterium]
MKKSSYLTLLAGVFGLVFSVAIQAQNQPQRDKAATPQTLPADVGQKPLPNKRANSKAAPVGDSVPADKANPAGDIAPDAAPESDAMAQDKKDKRK